MSDLVSEISNFEDNNSLFTDFDKSFSFIKESNINNISNLHSESIPVPEENSFLGNKNDKNYNKIFPNYNTLNENNININNEDKTDNNKIYINNNFNTNNDFQPNSIKIFPKDPSFQNINICPYIYPMLQNNQSNSINISPVNEINNNNLPLFNPMSQYNILNPICFNNLIGNNANLKKTFFKNNSKIIFNYKNRINKKNKNKNIIKKNEGQKYTNTFLKTENIIKIELLESGEEKRTCVRLFPIPHRYSPFDTIRLIDKHLKTIPGKRIYRSVYVPLIKIIGKNIGYCFVDLVSPKYVIEFYKVFNGLLLKKCKKPCSVIFSDKQNSDNINENPLREPIFFKDTIKDE